MRQRQADNRFEDAIPAWLFVLRRPALRAAVGFGVPLAVTFPMVLLQGDEPVRFGPLLVVAVLTVAAVAGSWPSAIAGTVAIGVFWWFAVPPTRSFALRDAASAVSLVGMVVAAAGVPVLARRLERAVTEVRQLDADRRRVTERERELRILEAQARLQAETLTELATGVGLASTAEEIAAAALSSLKVPAPPTGASIAVVDGPELRVLAATGVAVESLDAVAAIDISRSEWLREVVDGHPVFVEDRADFARRYPSARVLDLFTSGSWAVVPLRFGTTTALLSVHYDQPHPLAALAHHFGLAADIVATALERALAQQRLAEELERVQASYLERDRIARTLSTTLLPPRLPELEDFEAAGWIHPAHDDEVAGDFYDLFAVRNGWVAILGDVCGKGAEAAAVSSLARYAARTAALHDPDPGAIAALVNRALLEDSSSLFCTLAIVHHPGGDTPLQVALAGHPQIRQVTANGVERVGTFGTALGIVGGRPVTVVDTVLDVDETVLLFSDGLVERARDFDDDQLDAFLRTAPATRPEPLAAALGRLVDQLPADRPDDVAVLAITRTA